MLELQWRNDVRQDESAPRFERQENVSVDGRSFTHSLDRQRDLLPISLRFFSPVNWNVRPWSIMVEGET